MMLLVFGHNWPQSGPKIGFPGIGSSYDRLEAAGSAVTHPNSQNPARTARLGGVTKRSSTNGEGPLRDGGPMSATMGTVPKQGGQILGGGD